MTSVPSAYAETIRALGGPAVTPADLVAAWHIGPLPAVLAHFLDRQASAEEVECFYDHLASAVATVRSFPGIVEMLEALDRSGCRLGIVTSATRRSTRLMLAAAGLNEVFGTVICGDEVDRFSHPDRRSLGGGVPPSRICSTCSAFGSTAELRASRCSRSRAGR
jgi:phosphoglycolate phosphatase-like HAD superfamily hydrolase